MRLIYTLFAVLLASLCLANDTAVVGEGGRIQFMGGEHPSVRMVKEWVTIDISPNEYAVKAKFIFTNEGKATTVKMGFPEKGYGDIADDAGKQTSYIDFETTVDGEKVKADRVVLNSTPDEIGIYNAVWVKSVPFNQGQTRTIIVSYRSTPGEISMGDTFVRYGFTGGNWKGKVAESNLQLNIHLQGTTIYHTSLPAEKALSRQSVKGKTLSYTWKNWQADGGFTFYYFSADNGWMRLANDGEMSPPFISPNPHLYKQFITRPGIPDHPTWIAPVRLHGGGYFISLGALKEYFDASLRAAGKNPDTAVEWNGKTLSAVFHKGKTRLTFTVGINEFKADGKTLPLSYAPFLSTSRYIYVPLKETMAALGMTYTIDKKKREVTLK